MDDLIKYKEAAERLWSLLDNIDTLTDIHKTDYEVMIYHIHIELAKRHEILFSDGKTLSLDMDRGNDCSKLNVLDVDG